MSSQQILAGFHAVTARLRHAPSTIQQIYIDASRQDKRMAGLMSQAEAAGLKCSAVPAERLDGLARGTRHQGVVALAQANELANDRSYRSDQQGPRAGKRHYRHLTRCRARHAYPAFVKWLASSGSLG